MIGLVYAALIIVAAYLVGSIPIGLMIAKGRGIDIREFGSGNIGATNVTRALGKRLGTLVLVLDALKGIAPLTVLMSLRLHRSVDPFLLTLTGAAAIAGHCFSLWLRFRGGKGVATSLGVFAILDPLATLLSAGVFAATYGLFRVASLGSIIAVLTLPLFLWLFDSSDALVTLAIATAALIVFTHRSNLGRLVRGEEHKL